MNDPWMTLRSLVDGQETINVAGGTVREVIEELDAKYGGVKQQLCDEILDRLRDYAE